MPDNIQHASVAKPEETNEIPPSPTPEIPEKFRNEDGSLNQDALLRSYSELEGKKLEDAPAAAEVPTEESAEAPTEDGEFKLDTEEAPKSFDHLFESDQQAQWGEKWLENGSLEDADYSAIQEKLGVSKEDINSFFRGRQAEMQADAINVVETLGGPDRAKEIQKWTLDSMSVAEREAFNSTMTDGTAEQKKLALDGLNARYSQDVGHQGSMVRGRNPKGLQPFESHNDYIAYISDPRDKTSKTYRERGMARLAISNI